MKLSGLLRKYIVLRCFIEVSDEQLFDKKVKYTTLEQAENNMFEFSENLEWY